MIKHYSMMKNGINIDDAIEKHSADKVIAYKNVDRNPIY